MFRTFVFFDPVELLVQSLELVTSVYCSFVLHTFKRHIWEQSLCSLLFNESLLTLLLQGRYVLTNGTVNIDAVTRIAGSQMTSLQNRIWMPEIQVLNEKNELHVCFKVTGSFSRTRN